MSIGAAALRLGKRGDFAAPSTAPTHYLGNPNSYWDTINTVGGIVTSRDDDTISGVITIDVPGFIQVSAYGIGGSGHTSLAHAGQIRATDGTPHDTQYGIPFSDMEFHWDFGDPTGVETFTQRGTSRVLARGSTVNANDDQYGPEAAYCYRTAGTYTIKLTIRAKAKAGGYITTAITKRLVVRDWIGTARHVKTLYIDLTAGNNSWTGLLPVPNAGSAPDWTGATDGPIKTIAGLGTGNRYVAGTLVLIKRDTQGACGQWNYGNNIGSISGCRWNSYSMNGAEVLIPGVGAKPIINAANFSLISWRNFTAAGGGGDGGKIRDTVFSNFNVLRATPPTGDSSLALFALARTDFGTWKNIYFDNIDMEATTGYTGGAVFYGPSTTGTCYGIWNCNAENDLALTSPTSAGPLAFSTKEWFFYVGGTVGSSLSNTDMSHLFYTSAGAHMHLRWMRFTGGVNGALAVNTNHDPADPSPSWAYATTHVFTECEFDFPDGFGCFDFGGAIPNVWFRDTVIERCWFKDARYWGWYKGAIDVTWRDNEGVSGGFPFHFNAYDYHFAAVVPRHAPFTVDQASPNNSALFKFYRNKCYKHDVSVQYLWFISSVTQFTDNEFVWLRTSATSQSCLQFWTFTPNVNLGGLIDRNRYYTPNFTNPRLIRHESNATTYTLADFNTATSNLFDQNPPETGGTTTSNPNWPDAAAGDFGTDYAP
jgi:hypothetical protein